MGLGECLVFERNEVENYKETLVLRSGAIKPYITSVIHFEMTSKNVSVCTIYDKTNSFAVLYIKEIIYKYKYFAKRYNSFIIIVTLVD
jgi:hypothetical protein